VHPPTVIQHPPAHKVETVQVEEEHVRVEVLPLVPPLVPEGEGKRKAKKLVHVGCEHVPAQEGIHPTPHKAQDTHLGAERGPSTEKAGSGETGETGEKTVKLGPVLVHVRPAQSQEEDPRHEK